MYLDACIHAEASAFLSLSYYPSCKDDTLLSNMDARNWTSDIGTVTDEH